MKFKTDNYTDLVLDDKLAVDPECNEVVQELIAIQDMTNTFIGKMLKKMILHFMKGRKGWDNRNTHPDSFIISAMKDAMNNGDYISVANYAMIMWNRT